MPLRVQCPNGCVMRVPSNRAGMSARCPGCKAVVVVPFPPKDHAASDLLKAVAASSAIDPVSDIETVFDSTDVDVVKETDNAIDQSIGAASTPQSDSAKQESDQASRAKSKQASSATLSSEKVRKDPSEKPTPKLELPAAEPRRSKKTKAKANSQVASSKVEKKSKSTRKNREKLSASHQSQSQHNQQTETSTKTSPDAKPTRQPPNVPQLDPVATRPSVKKPKQKPKQNVSVDSPKRDELLSFAPKTNTENVPVPNLQIEKTRDSVDDLDRKALDTIGPKTNSNRLDSSFQIAAADVAPSRESAGKSNVQLDAKFSDPNAGMNAIEIRTRRATADRVTLTRFFASFLVFVGLVNFAPAIYCWYTWSLQDVDFLLPRWIYLQIFIAVLHWVYAILLLQVPDWSTLRSIAVVMLAFAFVFGLFSMGLVTSGSNGVLAQFLQVPSSLGRQACIWCVAMLCLATLASYLAGRESNAWQRTEKLLAEILAKKETARA